MDTRLVALAGVAALFALSGSRGGSKDRKGDGRSRANQGSGKPGDSPFLSGDSVLEEATPLPSPPLRNGRRTAAGYVMTGLPPQLARDADQSGDEAQILQRRDARAYAEELSRQGIKLLFSVEPSIPALDQELARLGIKRLNQDCLDAGKYTCSDNENYWNFHWWKDYDQDWTSPLLDAVDNRYFPDEIAIQCTHGVDRTGNIIAFLLATRHGVSIPDAYYAVVRRRASDVEGVASVLAEYGINDRRDVDDPTVGIYTYRGNGMSANTSGFKTYMREVIGRALDNGASW